MTIAQPAHDSRPEYTAREQRALTLLEERGGEIRRIGAGLYRVPSCSGSGSYDCLYGEFEACPCPDFQYGGGRPCKHLLAVGIMHAASRSGVKVRTIPAAIAGDPFKAAAKHRAEELRHLEEKLRHELLSDEERQELRDRVLRLRRRSVHDPMTVT